MNTTVTAMDLFRALGYEDDDYICISSANGKEFHIRLKEYPVYESQFHEMNASGNQMYFMPNKWKLKNGSHITNNDITDVTAHFIEIDGTIPEGLSREEEADIRRQLLEEQEQKILSFPLKPTFMIKTRKSIHTYWVVSNGDLEGFSQRQDRLNAHFGSDKSIRDLKRVMRLPGFKHNKGPYEYDVEVILYEPDNIYTIEELFENIPELPKQEKPVATKEGTIKYGLSRITDCSFIQYCYNNQKELPEPDWHALAGELKPFQDGRAAFHSISSGYDKNGRKYDPDEADRKFDNYNAGPMRCQTICSKAGFTCSKMGTCPAKSPSDLFRYPYSYEELVNKMRSALVIEQDTDAFTIRNKCLKFIELYMYNFGAVQAKELIKVYMKDHINSQKRKALMPETLDAMVQYQADLYKSFIGNAVQVDKSGILDEESENVMSDIENEEALAFLRDPELIDCIQNDLTEYGGLRNENENKIMVYFAATSRKMDKPISLTAFAQSSSGKSYVTNTVAEFMPPEDCIILSSVSSKAFEHMAEDDINHKFIVMQELEGVQDVLPTIRVMQSENFLDRAYTVKDEETGRMVTIHDRKECKSSIIFTTTQTEVNDENSTRVFSLFMDESRRQTEEIVDFNMDRSTLEYMAGKDQRDRARKLHQNAQRLLRPLQVVIPFAKHLKGNFPNTSTRHRRDSARFLDLIKVIAFLFQYQKQIKTFQSANGPIEYIEADLRDYFYAYKIGSVILQKGLSDISEREIAVLKLIKGLVEGKAGNGINVQEIEFTRKEVEQAAKGTDFDVANKHNLNRVLKSLVDKEYLVLAAGGHGKTYTYQVGFDITKDKIELMAVSQLLTPAELKSKLEQLEQTYIIPV